MRLKCKPTSASRRRLTGVLNALVCAMSVLSLCLTALPIQTEAGNEVANAAQAKKPNILVIFGDDVDYWNVSAYNRDLQMLQWTAAGNGPRFCLYVHHTDAKREWAYDRTSHIGKLDKGLEEATQHGWTVVDMAKDWKTIFTPAKK